MSQGIFFTGSLIDFPFLFYLLCISRGIILISCSSLVCISSIFLLVVNLGIDSITRPNHTSHGQTIHPTEKLISIKIVQNSLCCDMGMIIFDLHGYQRPKTLQRAHTLALNIRIIPQCQFCLPKQLKFNLNVHQ